MSRDLTPEITEDASVWWWRRVSDIDGLRTAAGWLWKRLKTGHYAKLMQGDG